MKTKKLYQAPLTERNVVELEGEFCSSVMSTPESAVEAAGHDTGFDSADGTDAFTGDDTWN